MPTERGPHEVSRGLADPRHPDQEQHQRVAVRRCPVQQYAIAEQPAHVQHGQQCVGGGLDAGRAGLPDGRRQDRADGERQHEPRQQQRLGQPRDAERGGQGDAGQHAEAAQDGTAGLLEHPGQLPRRPGAGEDDQRVEQPRRRLHHDQQERRQQDGGAEQALQHRRPPGAADEPADRHGHGHVTLHRSGASAAGTPRRRDRGRVGDLPQEEVRDPHLTTGADQQIGIRHAVGVEGAADVGLRDVVGGQLAGPHAAGQRAEGVEQLVAAAVVEGHQQGEAAVGARLVDDVVDPAPHRQRHAVAAPDHAQAYVALHQLRQLTVDRLLQQPHQRRDLVFRPAPVLRRERVERQVAQPDGIGRPHDGPGRLHALAMAGHPRQALDDGHVGRHRLRPDQREHILLA